MTAILFLSADRSRHRLSLPHSRKSILMHEALQNTINEEQTNSPK
jgi:hypothetical protein